MKQKIEEVRESSFGDAEYLQSRPDIVMFLQTSKRSAMKSYSF